MLCEDADAYVEDRLEAGLAAGVPPKTSPGNQPDFVPACQGNGHQ